MQITQQNAMTLVGIKVVGRISELSHRVPMAWLELKGQLAHIEQVQDPHLFYGVYPESEHLNGGSNGFFTYWATVAVSGVGAVPAGMHQLTIPAGRFATTTCTGSADAETPMRAYQHLSEAIAAAGLTTDGAAYGYELYDDHRQSPVAPYVQFDFDLYKPIE